MSFVIRRFGAGRFVLAALAGAVFAGQAGASVVIVSRTATLQTNTVLNNTPDDYLNQQTSPPTGAFADSHTSGTPFVSPTTGAYATGTISTLVGNDGLTGLSVSGNGAVSGQARGSVPANAAFTNALASLAVAFQVVGGPTTYTLAGSVFADRTLGGSNGIAGASVVLTDNDNASTVVAYSGLADTTPTAFNTTGVLQPGQYTLTLNAVRSVPPTTTGSPMAGVLAGGNFTGVTFNVAVPEPATLGLAGAAVVALGRRARRVQSGAAV